jgi:hypothetical protein
LVQADGVGGYVVGHGGERHGGEPPPEDGDVDDARVTQQLLCTLEQPLGNDTRLSERRGELVDDLLARVVERRRQAGDEPFHLLRIQVAEVLGDPLVLVVPVRRQPPPVDEVGGDLDLGPVSVDSIW